jgi:acetyl-CoA decarbonylase/synthase complex subunit beta
VHLHSLRRYPHSNCGCFQFLAFWLESRQGIGVMERGWAGVAPEGRTWDSLANAAGGKQAPGIVGVSEVYLKSNKFLKGDGGHAAVRWASPKAFEAIQSLVPDAGKVEVGAP